MDETIEIIGIAGISPGAGGYKLNLSCGGLAVRYAQGTLSKLADTPDD